MPCILSGVKNNQTAPPDVGHKLLAFIDSSSAVEEDAVVKLVEGELIPFILL